MKRLSFLILLMSCAMTPAYAKMTSMLCKADNGAFYDIVATNQIGTSILLQINGGEFLEGRAEFYDPILFVVVDAVDGTLALRYDVRRNDGSVSFAMNNGEKSNHSVLCNFRK